MTASIIMELSRLFLKEPIFAELVPQSAFLAENSYIEQRRLLYITSHVDRNDADADADADAELNRDVIRLAVNDTL